jgi:hypothetical protein
MGEWSGAEVRASIGSQLSSGPHDFLAPLHASAPPLDALSTEVLFVATVSIWSIERG